MKNKKPNPESRSSFIKPKLSESNNAKPIIILMIASTLFFTSCESANHSNIESFVKTHTGDPSSYESVSFGNPEQMADGTIWIKHTFRAKNGFGALVIHTYSFHIDKDGETVLSARDADN